MNDIGEQYEKARIYLLSIIDNKKNKAMAKKFEILEDVKGTRYTLFEDKKNPNFCYTHDDCVKKGYGFDRYIYIAGEWSRYGRSIYGFRNNKIAEVGYELSKCYQSKRPKGYKADQKYSDYCIKLLSKIDDMEHEYTSRGYTIGNYSWVIIETEIFK